MTDLEREPVAWVRWLAAVVALLSLVVLIFDLITTAVDDPLRFAGAALSVTCIVTAVLWTLSPVRLRRIAAVFLVIVAVALFVVELFQREHFALWLLQLGLILGIFTVAATIALRRGPGPARRHRGPLRPVSGHAFLMVNPRSGGGKAGRFQIAEQAEDLGIEVHVLAPEEDIVEIADQAVASGAEMLGSAGGDGSLGLLAGITIRAGIPFVCIPAGTRNHFARDVGLDRSDPSRALAAFTGDRVRIDAAELGDRVFVNNASFGAYADMVHEDRYRSAKFDTAVSVLHELRTARRPSPEMLFSDPDGNDYTTALLLFVGNNRYTSLSIRGLGGRPRLDEGLLHIATFLPETGRDRTPETIREWTCEELSVGDTDVELLAGVDGEALAFGSPLEIRSLPKALELMVPKGTHVPIGTAGGSAFSPLTVQQLVGVATGKPTRPEA